MRRASTKHVKQMATARRKATVEQRGLFRELRADLTRDVTAFLDIAAQTVPAFARAHQKMAKQQRSSLEAGRRELGAEVSKFRSAMQHDLMGAHQIWSALAHG
jgi:predicted hotdog family 3-hydroxylacyl-ACP dehydratase